MGVIVAWFPVSTLLHQRGQLAAASTELNKLHRENATLHHQETQLRTPSTLGRIAQQQYGLVPPGDQAYQVLPPSGSGSADGTLGPTASGDSGNGHHGGTSTGASGTAGSSGRSGSFLGRVLQTLEFWR